MAKVFITGSSDGLGLLAAKSLIRDGHHVTFHARNEHRKNELTAKVPAAEDVVIGDLSSILETKRLAYEVNARGQFDAVIHNAGVYQVSPKMILTINTLAPYILTCLIRTPHRLVYLSSGMHRHGQFNPRDFYKETSETSYSNSKLHVLMLSMAVARKWKTVYSNCIDPGWVPTRMGGNGAPDDLQKGYETQVWLATSDDGNAKVTGQYFFHKMHAAFNSTASDESKQEELLEACEQLTGVKLK